MKIEKLMSTGLITVDMDDSLSTVREIFQHFQFHHLLVLEKEVLLGVISDRDLLAALTPKIGTVAETSRDAALLKKRAHQICTRQMYTLKQDEDIFVAIDIFNQHNVSCVPVVDNNNKPVGIITWRDIIAYLAQKHQQQN